MSTFISYCDICKFFLNNRVSTVTCEKAYIFETCACLSYHTDRSKAVPSVIVLCVSLVYVWHLFSQYHHENTPI